MTILTDLSKTCELRGKNRTERQEIIAGWNKLEARQEISFQFWSEKFEPSIVTSQWNIEYH